MERLAQCLQRVKIDKSQTEHISSGLPQELT